MPMLILAIRVELEIVFKNNMAYFLGKKGINKTSESLLAEIDDNQGKVLRLLNGVVTEIFDPNMFFSRLSFLESSKDAVDIKYALNKGKDYKGFRMPPV